jgi:hypothetical protein
MQVVGIASMTEIAREPPPLTFDPTATTAVSTTTAARMMEPNSSGPVPT